MRKINSTKDNFFSDKFSIRGHMQNAVADFWTKLSLMNLNRKYDFDFEEYQSGGDIENGEIYIYISVN